MLNNFGHIDIEYEEVLYKIVYSILENARSGISCYDELKNRFDSHKPSYHHLFELKSEIVEKKFLVFKNTFTGMNKDKARLAMNLFNLKMEECGSFLDEKAKERIGEYEGAPGEWEMYEEMIRKVKEEFTTRLNALNAAFTEAMNTEIDNPNIGLKYNVADDFNSVTHKARM